jgi:hypothetical protein
MTFGTLVLFGCSTPHSVRSPASVIFGADTREDVLGVRDPDYLRANTVVAAKIDKKYFQSLASGRWSVSGNTLVEKGFCESERFSKQIAVADCSGVLVAPDIILTAGHCIQRESDCTGFYWAFGYQTDSEDTNSIAMNADQVFSCAGIIQQKWSKDNPKHYEDYALIRLDRPVPNTAPAVLDLNTSQDISKRDLFSISCPDGLPKKVSSSSVVLSRVNFDGKNLEFDQDAIKRAPFFFMNMTASGGSSGGPIFDRKTGKLLGIFSKGPSGQKTKTSRNWWGKPKVCQESVVLEDKPEDSRFFYKTPEVAYKVSSVPEFERPSWADSKPLLTANSFAQSLRQKFLAAQSQIDERDLFPGNDPNKFYASWSCIASEVSYIGTSWNSKNFMFTDGGDTLETVGQTEKYTWSKFGWLGHSTVSGAKTELRKTASGDLLAEISFADESQLSNAEDILKKRDQWYRPDHSPLGVVYQYVFCPRDSSQLEQLKSSLWPPQE